MPSPKMHLGENRTVRFCQAVRSEQPDKRTMYDPACRPALLMAIVWTGARLRGYQRPTVSLLSYNLGRYAVEAKEASGIYRFRDQRRCSGLRYENRVGSVPNQDRILVDSPAQDRDHTLIHFSGARAELHFLRDRILGFSPEHT